MQQATINLPSTNPVRALTGLARQIALPGEHAPERFPSFPALERTAVMAFTQPTSWSVPASTTVHGMLSRQATYPLWLDTPTGTSAASYHTVYASTGVSAISGPTDIAYSFIDAPLYNSGVGNSVAAPSSNIGITGSSALLSSNWPLIGSDESLGPAPFTYVPSGCTAYVITAGSSAFGATSWTVTPTVERWRNPGLVDTYICSTATVTNNTGCMSISNASLSGYWVRPHTVQASTATANGFPAQMFTIILVTNSTATYTGSAVNLGSITFASPVNVTALAPVAIPNEFSNSTIPWQDTRLTAVAGLFTNVTQVLNKGGTVLAGRLSPNAVNPWLVTSANITALHPAEKAWLPLETGLYTYCPPSTDLNGFWDYAQLAAFTTAYVPLYRLDNTSLVNHFFLTSSVAASIAVNLSWHIEFRTSSALFQLALSGLTLESLHAAQLVLAQAGFFFENPEHDSVLNKIVNSAKKIAPHLIGVAEMHPKTAVLAATAKGIMRLGQKALGTRKVPIPSQKPKMQTTTAKASGITQQPNRAGKPKKGKKRRN